MEEPEQRRLLDRALPLLAIVLMTSGIVVRTVPLESKRPADPEHARFSHAGLQDVEARLWEDPIGAIRHVQGRTPDERCEEALKDKRHYPYALSKLITNVTKRADIDIIILPVLVQGGPYFENGESRRRTRYAVVTALLNAGWVASDEDKMGYVWTFENCVKNPWARQIPELLSYEWFVEGPKLPSRESDAGTPRRQGLLILWLDEDAVSRAPFGGFERLAELFEHPETLCSPDEIKVPPWLLYERQELAKTLQDKKACDESHSDTMAQPGDRSSPNSPKGSHWHDMRVIGPSTSTVLQGMSRELAIRLVRESGSPQPDADQPRLHFYSATATAELGRKEFSRDIEWAKSLAKSLWDIANSTASPEDLQARFNARVVRLTTTDENLANELGKELLLRLQDQTPWQRLEARWKNLQLNGILSDLKAMNWQRLGTRWQNRQPLCEDTIVIIGEGDTSYTRFFREHFVNPPEDSPLYNMWPKGCGGGVVQVSYLRGLDGALPTGTGVPAPSAPQQPPRGRTDTGTKTISDILPDQATFERADGRSQYDYLRRLGAYLTALDRRERQEGRRGVTAIGVLGNDTYDKLLVLDTLRVQFPRAVFFAADLDARLLGREARRSTRNLVVASAYGLKLHRGLQGTAPPFRDTYQTGIYLATRVALDPDAKKRSTNDFEEKWFGKPRLFEIGRTRAVPLWQVGAGDSKPCDRPDPQQCTNIHPADEWRGFDPLPDRWTVVAVVVMVFSATVLGLLLSDRAPATVRDAFTKSPRWGVLILTLSLFVACLFWAGLWRIKEDVASATGEPFAWLEGVSIWPTQILQMLLLILTVALLVGERVWLRRKIRKVANNFHVPMSSSPWSEFLDRMQIKPSIARIVRNTVLFFLFNLALLSLAWPNSPHRGPVSAWWNHVLQVVLLAGMTALLLAALDASIRAAGLLCGYLDQYHRVSQRAELVRQELVEGGLAGHLQAAAEVTSAANWLTYLPFLAFFLLVLTRIQVFDAWVLPLPYVVLILLASGIALLQTIAIRRIVAGRRTEILTDIDRMAERYALQAKPAQEDVPHTLVVGMGLCARASELPASAKAELLRSWADRLRGMRDGPFRPFDQEPVVRALLLLLGGTGTFTIIEFLFLGQ